MVVQLRLPGLLSLSGITVACPEATSTILPLNVANYLDPTQRSDMELTVRKAAADIATTVTWLNATQGNGLLDVSTATTLNPSGTSIGGVTIFDNSGAVSNPFGVSPITVGGGSPVGGAGTVGGTGGVNIGGNAGAVGGLSAGGGGIVGNDISEQELSADSQLATKLSIISDYCDKYGATVDVEAIASEYSDDPEAGVKYCDKIINEKLDQSLLRKMIHKKYDEYNRIRRESGEAVANNWVKAVLEAGLGSPEITAGVNKRNVLEVVGAFATHKDVKNGKVSLPNVMESPEITLQLIEAMKARADEMLTASNVPDDKKEQVAEKVKAMRMNYDKYQESISDEDKHNDLEFKQVRSLLAKNFMDLFEIIRLDEAQRTDALAPQYYGLPENSSITFNDRTQRAQEEISSYKHRRRLSTTM